jgi:ATP-dependent DNA helicase RecG
MRAIDRILNQLQDAIENDQYRPIEGTDIELKDRSHPKGKFYSLMETVCAFLNTNNGIIIVGIREEDKPKKYVLTGFNFDNEPTLKTSLQKITDERGNTVDVSNLIYMQTMPFLDKTIVVLHIDQLPDDQKYVFYSGKAFERKLSGDHKIEEAAIKAQLERREELKDSRELRPLPNAKLEDLDVDKLNNYIHLLNRERK